MRELEKQRYWLEHEDRRSAYRGSDPDARRRDGQRGTPLADALAALGRLQGKQGRHIAALRLELQARNGGIGMVCLLVRQLAKRDALPAEVVRRYVPRRIWPESPGGAAIRRNWSPTLRTFRKRSAVAGSCWRRPVPLMATAGGDGDAQKPIETALERVLMATTGKRNWAWRFSWSADQDKANGAHRPRGRPGCVGIRTMLLRVAHGPGPHVPAPAAMWRARRRAYLEASLVGGVISQSDRVLDFWTS